MVSLCDYVQVATVPMTRAEVEAALQQLELASNVTVEAGQLLVSASNTVLVHTPLFRHPTYSQLVRLLFNFMASQASVVYHSNNHMIPSKYVKTVHHNPAVFEQRTCLGSKTVHLTFACNM